MFSDRLQAVKEIPGLNDIIVNHYIAPVLAPNVNALQDDNSQSSVPNPSHYDVLHIDSLADDMPMNHTPKVQIDIDTGFKEGIEMKYLNATRMTILNFILV